MGILTPEFAPRLLTIGKDARPFTVIIVCTAILLGIARILKAIVRSIKVRSFCLENGCQPPTHYFPLKDPILGSDFIRSQVRAIKEGRLLETLHARFLNIGATYSVKSLGRHSVLTMDPDNIKTILSIRFKDYSLGSRPKIMGKLMGRGIFVTDGAEWSHSRAMLRPSFVKDQVADLGLVESHFQDMLSLIPGDGSTVDLQELFFRFTIDSATDFLFGHSTHTLRDNNEVDRQFGEAFGTALAEIALKFRLGPFLALRRNADAAKAEKFCRTYVEQFVDEAMKYRKGHEKGVSGASTGKRYFIRDLAQATDDREKICDELLNILVAGRDTTASLLGSLFFLLVRDPRAWTKVRDEVAVLDGKQPGYEALRNLKYCKQCIQEALRLYPPVPTNARMAACDTVLPRGGGASGDEPMHVPVGNVVFYSVYAMHRRQDFYGEDADKFRPERWDSQRHSWDYLPFNGGPRICLGQQYALTEATYVLVRMAQNFEKLESRDSRPWTEKITLTASSANGVRVGLFAG